MYESRRHKTGNSPQNQHRNDAEEEVVQEKGLEKHPNEAVQRSREIIQNSSSLSDSDTAQPKASKKPIQPKLTVGQPGDKFEVEADAAADAVISMEQTQSSSNQSVSMKEFLSAESASSVQETDDRGVSKKEFLQTVLYDEQSVIPGLEGTQKKQISKKEFLQAELRSESSNLEDASDARHKVQKKEFLQSVEDEQVDTKPEEKHLSKREFLQAVQAMNESVEEMDEALVERLLSESKGSGRRMPKKVLQQMEASFDYDFSGVRIHTDQRSIEMCVRLGARAFTNGNDIYFNEGEFDPNSEKGRHLLAHELTHVIQQNGNAKRVQLKVKDPKEDPNFVAISPKRARANKDNLILYENTETTLGKPISKGDMLAIKYASKDKKWYYAETLVAKSVGGYILQVNVQDAADMKPPPDNVDGGPIVEGPLIQEELTDNLTGGNGDLIDPNKEDADKDKKDGAAKDQIKKDGEGKGELGGTGQKKKSLPKGLKIGDFSLQGVDLNALDRNAEFAKFKANAKTKKKKANILVGEQISKVQKSSKREQKKINTDAKLSSSEINKSYNFTIGQIRTNAWDAFVAVSTKFTTERNRIITERDLKLKDLETGTTERVNKMNTEGEKIAKAVEQYGKDEKQRVWRDRNRIRVDLENRITFLINWFNVPDRRQRMVDRLGAIKDEAINTIDEGIEELNEEIDEQTSELAESIREQYKEVAESLPDEKDNVRDAITTLADDAIEELDSIVVQPIMTEISTALVETIELLEMERTQVLANIETSRSNAVTEIQQEEEKMVTALRENLKAYLEGVDDIVEEVSKEEKTLPNALAMEYMLLGTHHIDKQFETLSTDSKNGATTLVDAFEGAYLETFNYLDTTRIHVITQNEATGKGVKDQLDAAVKLIGDLYEKVSNRVVKDIKNEVGKYLKTLDDAIAKCLLELNTEKNKALKDLKGEIDEVIAENDKVRIEARADIWDEAEQLATEWEITYGTRRVLEVIGMVLMTILKIILYIVIGIVALIALIIVVILLIATGIVDIIIAAVLAILRFVLPALLRWIGQLILRLIGSLIGWILRGLWTLITWLLRKSLVRLALFLWMVYEGSGFIWKAASRDDLPMSERQALMDKGILVMTLAIITEWRALQTLFKLTKGYKQFKALALLLGDAKAAARLVNFAKGDLELATALGNRMTATQVKSILPFADDAAQLDRVLKQLGDDAAARLDRMLLNNATNVEKVGQITEIVGDAAVAESLLAKLGSGDDLLALIRRLPEGTDFGRLDEVLGIVSNASKVSDDVLVKMLKLTDDELKSLIGQNVDDIGRSVDDIINNHKLGEELVAAGGNITKKGKVIGKFQRGENLELIGENSTIHGGSNITLSRSKTTTITGTLNDVNAVAKRGSYETGGFNGVTTANGPNVGGINILRSPQWGKIQQKYKYLLDAGETDLYWSTVSDEFWNLVNKPWLEAAIARGDNIRLVSDPALESSMFVWKNGKFILDSGGNKIRSIFSREVELLKSYGYKIGQDGIAIK